MSYGFETYRTDTSKNQDGLTKAGVFIERFDIAYQSNSGSKSYPMIPAGGLKFFNVNSPGHTITVDSDGSGYARINWSGGGSYNNGSSLLIFAQTLNEVNPYGMTIRNDAGQVIADYSYPVPQFRGTITPPANSSNSALAPDGFTIHTHTFTSSLGAGTDRLILINLPDNGSNTWYMYDKSFVSSDITGAYEVRFVVYAPNNTAYVVPTFHVYSLNGTVSQGLSYGIQLTRPDTSLVYDSSAENMTAADLLSVSYPAFGGTNNQYPTNMPTHAAVLVPYYYYVTHTATTGGFTRDRFFSVVKRASAGHLQFIMLRQDSVFVNSQLASAGAAPNTQTFCIVANAAYLSPGVQTGIPAAIAPPPPTGIYPSYNNPPHADVYEMDANPVYSIYPTGTTGGAWYNGSGNSALYEVKVSITSGTMGAPGGSYRALETWYTLDTTHNWSIAPPPKTNMIKYSTFSYQIRVKSNLQVVATSTFSLEYERLDF
jgi:hypothetical protein